MSVDIPCLLLGSLLSLLGMIAFFAWHERRAAQPQQPLSPPAQAAINTCVAVQLWVKWNPWFLEDEALNLEAQAVHVARQKTHPTEPLELNLAHVAQEMRRRHSEISAVTLN